MVRKSTRSRQIDVMRARGLIAAADAARLLSMHVTSVYRWMDEGEVEGKKVGKRRYITATSLEARMPAMAAEIRAYVATGALPAEAPAPVAEVAG